MNEYDVQEKIIKTFSRVYSVARVRVVKMPYGFDCTFNLDGTEENGIYDRGWFKWRSNGNLKLRLTQPL